MKLKFLGGFAITVILFQVACGQTDAGLTKSATGKLEDNRIVGVTVVVKSGVATLTGEVADVGVRAKAEAAIKSVKGIKSVTNNCTLMDLPADESVTDENDIDNSNIKGDLNQQARAYVEEYMTPRIAHCGDSYYVLKGANGLYQIKTELIWNVSGAIIPARPATAADRLNGRGGMPDTWDGRFEMAINSRNREIPWRYYRSGRWDEWRDDTLRIGAILRNFGNGWNVYDGQETPKILPKYKCIGNDIDMMLP